MSGSLKAANRFRTNGSTSGRGLQRPGRVIRLKRTGLAPTTGSMPCALWLRRQFLANGSGRITDLTASRRRSFVTPRACVQYLTSWSACMLTLLRFVAFPHLPDERSRTSSGKRRQSAHVPGIGTKGTLPRWNRNGRNAMDPVTRCLHCGRRLVSIPSANGRTELKCLCCDKVDPMETATAKWADGPLAAITSLPSRGP